MKKLFLALILAGASASMVFAQEAVEMDVAAPAAVVQDIQAAVPVAMDAVAETAEEVVESMTASGTVESLTTAEEASELVIALDGENKLTLVVKPTTTVYDAEWKATTLDQIKTGTVVTVKYLSVDGVNEALSINIAQ